MAQAGKADGDRLVAGIVVFGTHIAFWWLLTHATIAPLAGGTAEDALQVRWIDRPAPPPPPVVDAAAAPSPPRHPRRRPRDPDATSPDAAPSTDAPAADAPMSAVFIEQARALARTQARDAAGGDPFADRGARLPGRAGDTFRMREPRSLQGALRKVGKLFGGAGYDTDSCARIGENIAALANGEGRERALLEEELRRRRAYCH